MPTTDADLWHQVHAQRDDGVAAMFLIRDVQPRTDQPQIFVVEMPYAVTDGSKLPDAEGYRRLDTFQEQWIEPACEALGWTFVAWKSEDGAFSLYLYGDGDPNALLEKLAPFDGALGFFNDDDAEWSEYAALRELVEQAQAAPEAEHDHVHGEACAHEHASDATHREPTVQRDRRGLPGALSGGKGRTHQAAPGPDQDQQAAPEARGGQAGQAQRGQVQDGEALDGQALGGEALDGQALDGEQARGGQARQAASVTPVARSTGTTTTSALSRSAVG